MRFPGGWIVLAMMPVLLAGGCASSKSRASTASTAAPAAATQPVLDERARMSLSEIEPNPVLPPPLPQPQTPAPLESIEMYARAREAVLNNQRFTAISQLQQAIQIDPHSFEIYSLLGEAYLPRGSTSDDQSIAAFEKAAAIRPQDLETHMILGRQYAAKGDRGKAILHLRLARQTDEYVKDDASAALVDFFLGSALKEEGYDSAALEVFRHLIVMIERPTIALRANAELMYLLSRPELLYLEVGELQEKLGDYNAALASYKAAAEASPVTLEFHARVIRALIRLDRRAEAAASAAEVVRIFRANPESIALVRDVYRGTGDEADLIKELQRLHREQPDERSILYSLADLLREKGRTAEAQQTLLDAARKSNYNLDIVKRLHRYYLQSDQLEDSAVLLTETLAVNPEQRRELLSLFNELLRPSKKNRLRLDDVQRLKVSPGAEPARLYFVAQAAEMWQRDVVARSAWEEAVQYRPPFAPAYRERLSSIWGRADWDHAQKIEASDALIQSALDQNRPELAAELRGLKSFALERPSQAVEEFAEAIQLTKEPSADLKFTYATAVRLKGDNRRFEQLLWNLVNDHRYFDDAYAALFGYYLEAGSIQMAADVLQKWRSADPTSVNARIVQATFLFRAQQRAAAVAMINELFNEDSQNPQVLLTMQQMYAAGSQTDSLISLLEERLAKETNNRTIVEILIDIYAEAGRMADAQRVLDTSRTAVADDPDLLYYIAHLYTRIGQEATTEQILEQVVTIDPKHAPASNDLGYSWADKGRNMQRAEALIRVAVEAEPDNQSFLDSLAWVLYKRGKFAEARTYLEEAIGPANNPDPVILDHLGDTLYRLGEPDKAKAQWERSKDRLGPGPHTRNDLKTLGLQLDSKLKALESGQPVEVAPIVEQSAQVTSNE